MSGERTSDCDRYLRLLGEEIERRRQVELSTMVGDDPHRRLLQTLNEMSARLRRAPNFIEPTKAESRQATRELKTWLRRRGYTQPGARRARRTELW